MAQSTPGHHWHFNTFKGCHERSQYQRNLVTDSSRAVFVHKFIWERGPVQHLPRLHHGAGEVGGFLRCHSVEAYGHHPRCHLVVLHGRPIDEGVDEVANFVTRVGTLVVALRKDDGFGSHADVLVLVL